MWPGERLFLDERKWNGSLEIFPGFANWEPSSWERPILWFVEAPLEVWVVPGVGILPVRTKDRGSRFCRWFGHPQGVSDVALGERSQIWWTRVSRMHLVISSWCVSQTQKPKTDTRGCYCPILAGFWSSPLVASILRRPRFAPRRRTELKFLLWFLFEIF